MKDYTGEKTTQLVLDDILEGIKIEPFTDKKSGKVYTALCFNDKAQIKRLIAYSLTLASTWTGDDKFDTMAETLDTVRI